MKKREKTVVPRHFELNKALVNLGHKVIQDKKKRVIDQEIRKEIKDVVID